MNKIRPWKPRIKCVNGMWHATAPNGSHDARRALMPAITFCRRLNVTRQEGAE